jgi:hypothetical protein
LSKLVISPNLSLPVEVARRVFSFLAMRGAGKTYCAAVLAEEMMKAGIPIIVIDPMGVWYGLRVGKDGTGKGYPVVVFGGDHQDLPLDPENAVKLANAIVTSNISCVLDVSELSHTKVHKLVTDFLNEVRRINTEDRHIFMEEADEIAPQKPMRDAVYCLDAVDKFVRRGGNRNLGCTLITQRSAVLNKNVLSQSDFLVALRTNDPRDKDAVAAWAVRRTSDKKKLNAWLDSLSDLKDGEAYIWGPDMNIPGVRLKFRQRETFHATRENLKKYDASKIKPMDVSEFITKFRNVFEGKKVAVKETGGEVGGQDSQQGRGDDVHAQRRSAPAQRGRAGKESAKSVAPSIASERGVQATPTSPANIESVQVLVEIPKITATVSKGSLTFDDDAKARSLYALKKLDKNAKPKEALDFCAERGLKLSAPDFSNAMKALGKLGLVIRDTHGNYRLPHEIKFDLNDS